MGETRTVSIFYLRFEANTVKCRNVPLLYVLVLYACFKFLFLVMKYLNDYNTLCKYKRGIFISELNIF